jgi:uncharacterized protein
MRFSLVPREEVFFDLLDLQAKAVLQGAELFHTLAKEWHNEHPIVSQLRDLEHECDINTHEIMDKLNRTFVTPIDREDIHHLAKVLDDVIDIIQGTSERMLLFGIDRKNESLIELSSILLTGVQVVVKAVQGIRNFKHARRTLDYCIEIHRIENQGDRVAEKAIGNLFHSDTSPIEIIKWKEILDLTETAIDKCEEIANLIEGIVVKYG